ncbi:ABC transporter ATP-binding protein [Mesorhizobium sp.]|uniref:ABC transporter ATP-binding protein n=1 Tax=Mesorhizobium sp. TaxID=1871066 RepID=UPI001205D566|nr:ABC transporter ATP-binding protein [Mesorhizobium sp.]TIS55666.1 MAG: ABC transporter ATP-binding protein [Mesorhizobium sp.]TIS86735.1 MAG: ABC transporter ATP-binding protein [Mesorhizobium sp.]TJW45889.1 MAG: ABC transporter ATP-binding protein [Mesorhizobium sp.]
MTELVEVKNLRVIARSDSGRETPIVHDIRFTVPRGKVVALIGESGSGKTTIALSLMGYARSGCRITSGSVRIGEREILSLSEAEKAKIRGRNVSYIAQSAAAAFNPARTIMSQVVESAMIHKLMPKAEAEAKAVELFRALALPDPEGVGSRYPHQVSGGQLQRLAAAMALISEPELVIFDEPTTALDVTTQIEVLRSFKSVIRERNTTGVYVSHDLAVVAQIADHIIVLRNGSIQESAPTEQILANAHSPYTRSLLAAANPAVHAQAAPPAEKAEDVPLLEVEGLVAGYGKPGPDGLPNVTVLNDVGLSLQPGTNLGVIGESGCGKSTLARVIAGLLPAAGGRVKFRGETLAGSVADRSKDQLRNIQIVFQMADTALNPTRSVAQILGRPLTFYHDVKGAERTRRVRQLLDLVHLPANMAERLPGELSGGQKQRVNLARALAAEPALILCDEVMSALDTVVAAAILDLLAELRRELKLSYLFISHDLSTVRAICDDVMVLYAGRKVEAGSGASMRAAPLHPYSDLLVSSIPELRTGWLDGLDKKAAEADGGIAAVLARADRCPFVSRCPVRKPGVCDVLEPPVRHLSKGSDILCHLEERELLALGVGA